MATNLVDLEQLRVLIKRSQGGKDPGDLSDDPYTAVIAESASEIVRNAAHQPFWAAAPLDEGETAAPIRARIIALWLAKRAWADRGNLQRRTSGPASETYFEGGVRGLALEQAEQEWLEGQWPAGNSNGLWFLRHYSSGARRWAPYGDETPDGYSFAGGDWDFAHGMSMGGPVDGDSW